VAAARLIVVYREDPSKRYEWLGPPRPGDVLVTFDGLAHADLAEHGALLFDRLQSWEERSAGEHRVDELLDAVRAHPSVASIERDGLRLIDFAAFRLREELTRLLRGWSLARVASGAKRLVCDPAAPAALQMGAHAALGLEAAEVPYRLAPALPGSSLTRALARPVMRAVAARSRPARVRVAVVATGKLTPALAALPREELRELGVGTMPFPGLDYGNSALLALRRRLPMLATCGPPARSLERAAGPSAWLTSAGLPERPMLAREAAFDRALGLLVARVLAAAAPELDGVQRALDGLERARTLRALLLPTTGYGAGRLLVDWAHRRDLRVGVMQHGIYALRTSPWIDGAADLLFGWGEGTADSLAAWPQPHPRLVCAGVPGTLTAPPRTLQGQPRRVLVAGTGSGIDTPLTPLALSEEFIDVVAPSLVRLAAGGVELRLRPHPNEQPERYRQLLARHNLPPVVAAGGPFTQAAAWADLVIASGSSVAFEAAALGLPVLLWRGSAPPAVRREHLTLPWTADFPGMFADARDLHKLVDALLEHPRAGLRVAHSLRTRLERYAQPFDPTRFAEGLHMLGE
jgi:hypothetical protein